MFAGTIKRSYGGKNDSNIYRKIIKKRIEDVWEFK